jgi:F0F1-type ATP synthase assembly protein I
VSSAYDTSSTGDRSTAPDSEDTSLGSLVGALSGNVSKLMRQELELAKAEIRAEAKKAGKAAGMLSGAAFAGWMTAIFLSTTLMWLLSKAMDLTLAALIVTLLWGIAAAVLGLAGKKRMQALNPKPEQTMDSLKEDAQWLKAQKN